MMRMSVQEEHITVTPGQSASTPLAVSSAAASLVIQGMESGALVSHVTNKAFNSNHATYWGCCTSEAQQKRSKGVHYISQCQALSLLSEAIVGGSAWMIHCDYVHAYSTTTHNETEWTYITGTLYSLGYETGFDPEDGSGTSPASPSGSLIYLCV